MCFWPYKCLGFVWDGFRCKPDTLGFLAIYFKSNSANKINHLDNLPFKVGFSKRYFNGSILATTHIWKGKMMSQLLHGLNKCEA